LLQLNLQEKNKGLFLTKTNVESEVVAATVNWNTSIKIGVIGHEGTGKSCITIQLISGTFVETYDPTLEDSYKKRMTVDGQEVILNIFDTAGQEDFSSVRDQYIKASDCFIIVYSITSETSFSSRIYDSDGNVKLCSGGEIQYFLQTIDKIRDGMAPCVVVGNKVDLAVDGERDVSYEAGKEFCDNHNIPFLEVSAKTKTGIVELFEEVVRTLRKNQCPSL